MREVYQTLCGRRGGMLRAIWPCEDFMNEQMPPCEKETATVVQDCPNLPDGGSESGDTFGETGVSSSTG